MTIQHPSVGPRPALTLIRGGAGPAESPASPPASTPEEIIALADRFAAEVDAAAEEGIEQAGDDGYNLACRATLARLARCIVALHTNPIEGQQVVLATFDLEALPELAGLMYQGRREP